MQKQDKPLISFVVTYHNETHEQLSRCMESILTQPMDSNEREIVVIDDGSDVSPRELLASMSTEIKLVSQENAGQASARNTALTMAQGEYIQFVDSDDCLAPAYEGCIAKARLLEHDVIMLRSTDDTAHTTEWNGTGVDYLRKVNLRAAAWGHLFRRSIVGQLRFPEGLVHEDEYFTPLIVLRAEKLCDTNIKAYDYSVRNGSTTHPTTDEKKRRLIADKETVLNMLTQTLATLHGKEHKALSRRIAQLTMDLIYDAAMLTHSPVQLYRLCTSLRRAGLYPLPLRLYTAKYLAFSVLTHLI